MRKIHYLICRAKFMGNLAKVIRDLPRMSSSLQYVVIHAAIQILSCILIIGVFPYAGETSTLENSPETRKESKSYYTGVRVFPRLDLQEAKPLKLRRSIALHPNFAEAHNSLGVLSQDRREVPREHFKREIRVDSYHRKTFFQSALNILQLKENPDAIKVLQAGGVEWDTRYPSDLLLNAYNQIIWGDFEGSIQTVRSINESNTSYPTRLQWHLGLLLHEAGSLSEAVERYSNVIAFYPLHLEAHYNKGLALMSLNEAEKAIEEFKFTLQLKPDHIGARYHLGNLLYESGFMNKALENLRKAIKLRPNFVNARYSLAQVLTETKNIQLANYQWYKAKSFKAPFVLNDSLKRRAHLKSLEPEDLWASTDIPILPGARLAGIDAPYYNVTFDPFVSKDPLVLQDGKKTTINFSIGDPQKTESDFIWTVNPELLKGEDQELIVTMNCRVCLENSLQSVPIIYSVETRTSSLASFEITPRSQALDESKGYGHIVFDIGGAGVEYDHFVTCVFVGGQSTEDSLPCKEGQRLPIDSEDNSADVVFNITTNAEHQAIGIEIIPHSERLLKLFKGRHLDSKKFRVFRTGFNSTSQLQEIVREAYLKFRHISEQSDELLRNAFSTTTSGAVDLSRTLTTLKDEDRKQIEKALTKLGHRLYTRLFSDGDPDLLELISILEEAEIEDLRLVIRTYGVYAPWQILRPTGDNDVDHFWGYKFDLSVIPSIRGRRGLLPGPTKLPKGTDVVFGYYRNDSGEDIVERYGKMQSKTISTLLNNSEIFIANKGTEFIDQIKSNAGVVKFIATYSHANSGPAVISLPQGDFGITERVVRQRLNFSQNDVVTPGNLDGMRYHLIAKEAAKKFLKQEPIVVLNGCETGTGGVSRLTDESFPGILINLGARGVVVTEAPVWQAFAYKFGNKIINGLFAGKEMGKLILEVRRSFLKEENNPLGLLYSYYGNPAASFTK